MILTILFGLPSEPEDCQYGATKGSVSLPDRLAMNRRLLQ